METPGGDTPGSLQKRLLTTLQVAHQHKLRLATLSLSSAGVTYPKRISYIVLDNIPKAPVVDSLKQVGYWVLPPIIFLGSAYVFVRYGLGIASAHDLAETRKEIRNFLQKKAGELTTLLQTHHQQHQESTAAISTTLQETAQRQQSVFLEQQRVLTNVERQQQGVTKQTREQSGALDAAGEILLSAGAVSSQNMLVLNQAESLQIAAEQSLDNHTQAFAAHLSNCDARFKQLLLNSTLDYDQKIGAIKGVVIELRKVLAQQTDLNGTLRQRAQQQIDVLDAELKRINDLKDVARKLVELEMKDKDRLKAQIRDLGGSPVPTPSTSGSVTPTFGGSSSLSSSTYASSCNSVASSVSSSGLATPISRFTETQTGQQLLSAAAVALTTQQSSTSSSSSLASTPRFVRSTGSFSLGTIAASGFKPMMSGQAKPAVLLIKSREDSLRDG